MKKNRYLKWAFWIIYALQFLVFSLDLHYQIIKNSFYVHFYYNNYNLAPSITLNYFSSHGTTDYCWLRLRMGTECWGLLPSSTLPNLIMIPLSVCFPGKLLGRGSTPVVSTGEILFRRLPSPLDLGFLWENSIFLKVSAHYFTPLD